jgi:hypothetical protein
VPSDRILRLMHARCKKKPYTLLSAHAGLERHKSAALNVQI